MEPNETYDSLRKKLEKAFEVDTKQMLYVLLNNHELGDSTVEEYVKKIKSVIGDTDDKSRMLMLTLMNRVLPKTLRMETNKMFHTQNKSLDEIATDIDKLLENYSDIDSQRNFRNMNPNLINRLGPKIEQKDDKTTDDKTDIDKRLTQMEKIINEVIVKKELDKQEIISTIQSISTRNRSTERNYGRRSRYQSPIET